ncbi:MAG: hypothetical protein ACLT98_07760 [Eggerthellaceae bacterium]
MTASHQAEDGHGQARGNAEDGERAGGEGLDETPSGDAGTPTGKEQAEGGEGDADAVNLSLPSFCSISGSEESRNTMAK